MWTWFLTTRVGRYLAAGAAGLLMLVVLVLRLLALGRQQERARQRADKLKAILKRKISDEKVDSLGADDVRSELSKWMRDGR